MGIFTPKYPDGAAPAKKPKRGEVPRSTGTKTLYQQAAEFYEESRQNDPPNPDTPGKCARCDRETFLDDAFCERHMNGRY